MAAAEYVSEWWTILILNPSCVYCLFTTRLFLALFMMKAKKEIRVPEVVWRRSVFAHANNF